MWSPSIGVSVCFLAQVRQLEQDLKLASGVSDVVSDFVSVDYNELANFLRRIGNGQENYISHISMRLLTKGVIVHLLALLLTDRTLPTELATPFPTDWIEEAIDLSKRTMQKS